MGESARRVRYVLVDAIGDDFEGCAGGSGLERGDEGFAESGGRVIELAPFGVEWRRHRVVDVQFRMV